MSSYISVSGLGSGLDWENIISQLMQIERRPVTLLETRKSDYESRLEAFSTVNTKLFSLKTQADSLKTASTFHAHTASSSDETVVTATATAAASIGTYSISVSNLASAHKIRSDSFSDTTTALNLSGDIIINGKLITLDANDSLATIKNRINSADADVTATILDVSSTEHYLILTSQDTGVSNSIDLVDANTSNILQSLGLLSSSETTQDYSDQFTSDTTSVGTLLGLSSGLSGTVQINGVNVSIDLSTDSLQDIATAINNADAGTTASVTSTTVDGTTMYRIELTGTNTYTDSNNILETLGFVNGVIKNELQAAQDASLTVDGISATRSSNTISDLIEGMTLYLNKAGSADITVTNDIQSVRNSIEEFVNSYNDLMSYINDQFSYNESSQGVLMGDSTLRLVRSSIRDIVIGRIEGLSGDISALSQIGITTDISDGTLTIDETKLNDALNTKLADVEEFFLEMASQLYDKLDSFTDPYSGIIASRKEGIQETIDDLEEMIESMERRLQIREEKLREQFVMLEVFLSQMQAQNTWLTQQISSLSRYWGTGGNTTSQS